MRKILIVVIISLSIPLLSQSSKNIDDFEFYYGYKDYLEDKPVKSNVKADIKDISPKIFKVGRFKYKETDKNAKQETFTWAIKYQNDYYFNMLNAAYIYSDYFVKVDITGKRYWVIFLNEKTDKKAIGTNNPYGGGVLGAALNMKPRSHWRNKEGNYFKILLIDFQNPNIVKSRPKDNNAYLVDTKKILELTNNDETTILKLKEDNYTIEDFAEFINSQQLK